MSSSFWVTSSAYTTEHYGWAPVLELISTPPKISGEDEGLGVKSDGFSYEYTTSYETTATTIINITEKLNGEIIGNHDYPTELSRELTITKEHLKDLEFLKTNTIEIIVTDDLGLFTTRKLTFSRGAGLLSEDTALLDVVESVGDLVPYIQGGKNMIGNVIVDFDDSIVIPTEPTFSDLASAIGGISTGKKWASGDLIAYNTIEVNGLDFRPSTVAIYYQYSNQLYAQFYQSDLGMDHGVYSTSGSQYATVKYTTILSDGFSHTQSAFSDGKKYFWIAIE